jgi:hypothetical protein
MASSSASPAYSNDPDQWWQPDPMDDPDWEPENPLKALGDLFSELGKGIVAAVDPIAAHFTNICKQWAEVNTGHVHIQVGNGIKASKQQAHDEILRWMGEELTEESVTNFVRTYQAAEPILEVMRGHHTVCHHKPRCKPPGPGAAFNTQATQKRRNTRGSPNK